jgi:hypothetical protein
MVVLALLVLAVAALVYRYWQDRRNRLKCLLAEATRVQNEVDADNGDFDFEDLTHTEARGTRVNKPHHGSFRKYLVREGKAKFGCPKVTEANRLTIRKFLYDLCRERGLIARHIADHLDVATALVLVPSRVEIQAAAILKTAKTRNARDLLHMVAGDGHSVA